MPKKTRQAHVPKQQVAKRRQPRRTIAAQVAPPAAPAFAETPAEDDVTSVAARADPVATRPRRRLEVVQRTHEPVSLRTLPGQLPTFERAYMVRELRTIGVISTSLLALIILLTFVLR
jgi:hypothetical protein